MIITADKNRSDGVAYALCQKINTGLPIILVSRSEKLDFNEQILELKGKPYLLIDFVELGWQWGMAFGHKWNENTNLFPEVFQSGWDKLEQFMAETPPLLIFQRELLNQDVTDKLVPIQYPCFLPPELIQSFEEFTNRPFDVFFNFGISNEYRKELHGNIWKESGKYGYSVLDNLFYVNQFIENEKGKKWASIHTAHYVRQPIETVMDFNRLAKISISLPGAGKSCFRTCESPVNSTMLQQKDNLAWSIPWTEENCILAEPGKEIEAAISALNNSEKLYEIYKAGVENVDRYRIERYCKEYIEPLINHL